MSSNEQTFDVIVVGCGIAGLSAAVAAQQRGAKVGLLERAPIEERGGNTRHTPARLRMKSITEVTDDFIDYFANNAGGHLDPSLIQHTARDADSWPAILRSLGFADPEVIATFADEVPHTMEWLQTFGLKFEPLPLPFPAAQPRLVTYGGGLAMIEALAAHLESGGGRIIYETAAHSLIVEDSGEISGINAIGPGNKRLRFRAKAVILACGGFQGNPEMMTRYVGPHALYLRGISQGCYYNKGEGIRMALDIGAAPSGDYANWHSLPTDPRSGQTEPAVYIYPYGILVNKQGRRFLDEAPGPNDGFREAISREISTQPGGIAYAIVDARFDEVPSQRALICTDEPPITATSIAELAETLGLSPQALEATVTEFNNACSEAPFTPLKLDKLSTHGITPPKSNWAHAIRTPPFKAFPVICSIVFTFGGLKVNSNAQVINQQGDAIPGLYAAGETMGIYYKSYVGATSVMRGAVFGRLAGLDAVRRCLGRE